MGLVLLNLQSNHEIYLDVDNPFVIGRGNLTGCADKRVSRSHGKITCTTDGKVNLQALHSNPCFFTRNGIPPVRQLNKNEEEVLNEGDCIGLLPNSYWYQITSKSRVRDAKLNNLGFKSSQRIVPKTDVPTKVEVIDVDESSEKSPTFKHSPSSDNKNNTPGENVPVPSCSGESSNTIIPPELRNTCKLPLCMYEIKGQNLQKPPVKENKNCVTTKGPDIAKTKHPLGAESTSHGLNAGTASNSTAPPTDNVKNKSSDEKEGCEDDSNDSANACEVKPGRPYCRYDSSCYRKNAQHKLEYSHPGDEDYVPYENRPVCEYGAHCYRRNLAHKRQFRHVTNEDPQTSQASDAPIASTADSAAPSTSSNLSSAAKSRGRSRGHHKRKRRADKERSSRSCHLSVTVSASPKQKRGRSGLAESTNRSSFSSDISFEDLLSSPGSFSDYYSSDYYPSNDGDSDFLFDY